MAITQPQHRSTWNDVEQSCAPETDGICPGREASNVWI